MHAHGAAMHDATYPSCLALLDELPGSIDVHLTVLRIAHARPAKYRGQVVDSVDSLGCLTNYTQVPDITFNEPHPRAFQYTCSFTAPDQTSYAMSGGRQAQRKR